MSQKQLQQELDRAIAERARLDVVIAYLRDRVGSEPGEAVSNGAAKKRKLTAAQAAQIVLEGREGPMRTPKLLAAVQEQGAKIKDTDSLYRALLRDDRFERVGRGLWALKNDAG